MEICLFPHGFCNMIPCSHMESYWNGQNILRKYLNEDNLAEPLLHRPYLTCIRHNPYGKLPVSIQFLLNGSMLTHGIIFECSKYLKKISTERYFRKLKWSKYLRKITKVTQFRQAKLIHIVYKQYHAKSMGKIAYFDMYKDK